MDITSKAHTALHRANALLHVALSSLALARLLPAIVHVLVAYNS